MLKRFFIYSIFCVVTIFLGGCDIIAAIKDYFQKPDQAMTAQKEIPMQTAIAEETAPQAQTSQNILARVGNWTITPEEFQDRLNAIKEVIPDFKIDDPQSKKLVIDELIRQQMVVIDAETSGLTQRKDIIEAVDEFRRTLIVREATRKLTENIKVADAEAKAFYEEQKANLIKPLQWHVREIVVASQLEATEALSEILKGADFAEVAKARSKGKTAASGGDLGFLSEEPFMEMSQEILALESGKVSNVFKGPEGFYIVKLEEKKGGEQIAFDEIKDQIIEKITFDKQQKAIQDYLTALEGKIKVELNETLL